MTAVKIDVLFQSGGQSHMVDVTRHQHYTYWHTALPSTLTLACHYFLGLVLNHVSSALRQLPILLLFVRDGVPQ